MGDRTTPMKFGPEWLRNLSRERSSPASQSVGGAQSSTPPNRPITSIATTTANTTASPNTSKVLLAKLRYGREELLALYDRQTVEAPSQLKSIELLYHARGKPPYALSNNFEDDTRDSAMRNNPPIGSMSSADRYGVAGRGRGMTMGDGRGRGLSTGESRGRARIGYVRQTSLGRAPSWHNGGQRTYPGTPEDDPNPPRGLWNNGNGMNPPGMRPSAEQADWAAKMAYRKNRQNHTNWRQQQNREEGEEWRSSDAARRGQEKWEREWPERSNQEKPWTPNRRHWGGDNNEDSLPEWAMDTSDSCGGTFDSSGAFHGYSNDDSNIPKVQEPSYPLTRSQTHGSFARSKTFEEGSEEWWASEKAKKLSAKRFDASEVKFKMATDENSAGNTHLATNTGANTYSGQTRDKSKLDLVRDTTSSREETDCSELQDEAAALPIKREEHKDIDKKDRTFQQNYPEHTQPSSQQRIDMLLRTEEREPSSERGNYKSVMMTPNNNHLRQKHQSIVATTNEMPNRLTGLIEKAKQQARLKNNREVENLQKQQETKLVEDMLNLHLSEDLPAQFLNSSSVAGDVNSVSSMVNQLPSPGMQMRMNPILNQGMGLNQQSSNSQSQSPALPHPQGSMMRPIGITNSMLNASLGLPIGGSNMGLPLTSMPPPSISNPGILSSSLQGMGGSNMQSSMQQMQSGLQPSGLQVGNLQSGMQVPGMQGNNYQQGGMPANMQGNMQSGGMNSNSLQSGSGMPGYQGNNSLFGAPNNMQSPNDMSNHMYPMHGHSMQQPPSQSSFTAASLYGNMMQPPPAVALPNIPLTEQWYYEDPKKTIQGPFTSKEMYNWYRAGFFSPELMVRRACESGLRPLANYGIMPFGPMDLLPPQFNQLAPRFDMRQTSHDNSLLTVQQVGLGPEVESLWSQPSANDMMWIQQPMTNRDDNSRVNNLPMYFWDQPSGMPNSLMPEGITKEMKTEDEILAQMRASQREPSPTAQSLTFISDAVSPEDAFTAGTNIAPNLEELQKLIESDNHVSAAHRSSAAGAVAVSNAPPAVQRPQIAAAEKEKKSEKVAKIDLIPEVSANQQVTAKTLEVKLAKPTIKAEEKPAKNKDVVATKAKTKKPKDEIKEDAAEVKVKEEEKKTIEKRPEEPTPPTNKREDKANKKDLEKEKKEWLKDGFTIVKGAEKKDSKKKEREEARAAEETEKKKKEDEKRALLEAEKNRSPEPVTRRQQLEFGQVQRQTSQVQVEQAPKKAPWSASSASRDGLALSDIQRLEREKKLEQMKEQQQMMQVIAQQQAVAAQREQQEMHAGQLGWAKKKQPSNSPPGQTLAEIQAEARKQAAAMAASYAAREEAQPTPPPLNAIPWTTNGGGFWDSPVCTVPSYKSECSGGSEITPTPTLMKTSESKPKKKVTLVAPPKKEASPSADFDTWCINVLSTWRDAANIDIPTFVAFLRDIESPYEVKDYVKCYLGDTREASDFARQFLERRSRLLRVGMVTPSDDLCSPAAALTPRTNSGSDYTEIKSKANKKTKKNKMLKVDARILGFSVTASEDRINIGDIDTV